MKSPVCVVIEPQHEYALALIDRMYSRHGVRAVCVYGNARAELQSRSHYPALAGPAVAASYCVPAASLREFGAFLTRRYQVLGVVPPTEKDVDTALVLLPALPIAWNETSVLGRFRDKHELKTHLHRLRPDLNMTRVWRVPSAAELGTIAAELPERFVLKPVDGMGLRGVRVFAGDELAAAQRWVTQYPGRTFVAEEFVPGQEYAINGQVDAAGVAHVFHVLRYDRTRANGVGGLYLNDVHVHQDTDTFRLLAAYAREVMRASGLVRSPFHMEAIVNERGAWLVEVGARLAGGGFAQASNDAHGGSLDVFEVAVRHYLFPDSAAAPACAWDFYNRIHLVFASGLATRREIVYSLRGVDRVEHLPEFVRWVVKPQLWQLVVPTVDLFTHPFIVELLSHDRTCDVAALAGRVRALVRWNEERSLVLETAADVRAQARRYASKLEWVAAASGIAGLTSNNEPLREWRPR